MYKVFLQYRACNRYGHINAHSKKCLDVIDMDAKFVFAHARGCIYRWLRRDAMCGVWPVLERPGVQILLYHQHVFTTVRCICTVWACLCMVTDSVRVWSNIVDDRILLILQASSSLKLPAHACLIANARSQNSPWHQLAFAMVSLYAMCGICKRMSSVYVAFIKIWCQTWSLIFNYLQRIYVDILVYRAQHAFVLVRICV